MLGVRLSLLAALVFEGSTLLATQAKAAWAASPWQDDPYHAVLCLTQIMVPLLAVVITVRLFAWRAPGSRDRASQSVRAAEAMTTLVWITLASEWIAVVGRQHMKIWGSLTALLIGGLVVTTVLAIAAGAALLRCRRPSGERWEHDWLDDAILIAQMIPALRGRVGSRQAAWLRRHAIAVFAELSALVGAAVAAAQAVGEGITSPLAIAWFWLVVTAALFAFSVMSNRVAGFVACIAHSQVRRTAEMSVVAGSIALLVATAFHDALWAVVGTGPLTSLTDLVALTVACVLVTAALTAAALLAGRWGRAHTERDRREPPA